MKVIVFTIAVVFAFISSYAQIRIDVEDAYAQKNFFGISAGGSIIKGDLANSTLSPCYSLIYGMNKSQKTSFYLEGSFGTLYSYTPSNHWTSGLKSINDFTALSINIRHSFNNVFKSKESKMKETKSRLYIAIGGGFINNNLGTLTEKYRPDQNYFIKTFKTKSVAGIATENMGFDYKLPRTDFFQNTIFNVNVQTNFAFSDYVDGYNFASSTNKLNDVYFLFTAGLHFYFGEKK